MAKSGSQKNWLREHFDDKFVKQAQKDGYRCRAVYKLIEMQKKDKLFKPGDIVVDLGAAPGGWSELVRKWVGKNGQVIALDLLKIDPIPGVTFIQGDFSSDEVYEKLLKTLDGQKIDWVISDMAPNLSGNKTTDQGKSIHLIELALEFSKDHLKPGGGFLAKVFQGEGFDNLLKETKSNFNKAFTRKPEASRARSAECYLLGLHLK